jgi:hypothetical protein
MEATCSGNIFIVGILIEGNAKLDIKAKVEQLN